MTDNIHRIQELYNMGIECVEIRILMPFMHSNIHLDTSDAKKCSQTLKTVLKTAYMLDARTFKCRYTYEDAQKNTLVITVCEKMSIETPGYQKMYIDMNGISMEMYKKEYGCRFLPYDDTLRAAKIGLEHNGYFWPKDAEDIQWCAKICSRSD